MEEKFALVEFAKNKEEIPVRIELIKKAPEKFFDWYVRKFNPFTMKAAEIGDISGFNVKLPFEKEFIHEHMEIACELLDRTLISLYDFDVRTAKVPDELEHVVREGIEPAQKNYIMPCFLMEIIGKILRYIKTDLKYAEILVIADEYSLGECVLDMVYPHVNYLSVICKDSNVRSYFSEKAYEIFDDTGLNLQVFEEGQEALKSADIIIDLSEDMDKNDYYYKRGAALISIHSNKEKIRQSMIRREDLLIVNNAVFSLKQTKYSSDEIFMYLYLSDRNFRSNIQRRTYNRNTLKIKDAIGYDQIKINSLISGNTVITAEKVNNFLKGF